MGKASRSTGRSTVRPRRAGPNSTICGSNQPAHNTNQPRRPCVQTPDVFSANCSGGGCWGLKVRKGARGAFRERWDKQRSLATPGFNDPSSATAGQRRVTVQSYPPDYLSRHAVNPAMRACDLMLAERMISGGTGGLSASGILGRTRREHRRTSRQCHPLTSATHSLGTGLRALVFTRGRWSRPMSMTTRSGATVRTIVRGPDFARFLSSGLRRWRVAQLVGRFGQ